MQRASNNRYPGSQRQLAGRLLHVRAGKGIADGHCRCAVVKCRSTSAHKPRSPHAARALGADYAVRHVQPGFGSAQRIACSRTTVTEALQPAHVCRLSSDASQVQQFAVCDLGAVTAGLTQRVDRADVQRRVASQEAQRTRRMPCRRDWRGMSFAFLNALFAGSAKARRAFVILM